MMSEEAVANPIISMAENRAESSRSAPERDGSGPFWASVTNLTELQATEITMLRDFTW